MSEVEFMNKHMHVNKINRLIREKCNVNDVLFCIHKNRGILKSVMDKLLLIGQLL